MKKLAALSTSVSLLAAGLLAPVTVFAETVGIDCNDIKSKGGFNFGCGLTLSSLISTVVILIFIAATLLAFLFLIIGGIRCILSGGDKEGTTKARSMITAAIIGLAIVFLSFVIMNVVGSILGVNIIGGKFNLPTLGQ